MAIVTAGILDAWFHTALTQRGMGSEIKPQNNEFCFLSLN